QDAQPRNTARSEGAARRQESHQGVFVTTPGDQHLPAERAGHEALPKIPSRGSNAFGEGFSPSRQVASGEFLPLFAEKKGSHVERFANLVEVAPGGYFATLFIILDSLGKH